MTAPAHDPAGSGSDRLRALQGGASARTTDTGERADDLATANRIAGLDKGEAIERIVRVVVHGEGADAEYDLHHHHGARIEGTRRDDLYQPRKMDPALTQACPNSEIPWSTPKEWRPFAAAIIRAAERASTGTSRDEETREWLAAFIDENCEGPPPRVNLRDPAALFDALTHDWPAIRGHDDRLYVRQSRLLAYVTAPTPRGLGQRTARGDLERRLGRLGYPPAKAQRPPGRPHHRPPRPALPARIRPLVTASAVSAPRSCRRFSVDHPDTRTRQETRGARRTQTGNTRTPNLRPSSDSAATPRTPHGLGGET